MKLGDITKLAWRQLKERKLRAILTILAVAVGVTVIVAISSQVEYTTATVTANLEALGPTTIIVTPGGFASSFSDADVYRVLSLSGVSKVIPLITATAQISSLDETVTVIGISPQNLQELLGDVRVVDGETYTSDIQAPIALVGYMLASDLSTVQTSFGAGQPLTVGLSGGFGAGSVSITFQVIGVLDKYGISFMNLQVDNAIFVPASYLRNYVRGQGYNMLIVKADTVDDVNMVSNLIQSVLTNSRTINLQQILSTVSSVTSQMSMLLISIASTSFVAAGLGTFNIMMINILERVREIGLVKALGMKNRTVLTLYLLQALIIGALGGVVGLGIGVLLSSVMGTIVGGTRISPSPFGGRITTRTSVSGTQTIQTSQATQPTFISLQLHMPYINPFYVALAITLSIIVSVIAAIYPSIKAARLNPAEALRHE